MATVSIKASKRDGKGTAKAKALRNQGKVPAILYGAGTEPTSLILESREALTLVPTAVFEQKLVTLEIEGDSRKRLALLQDVQVDPIKDLLLHIDLHEVDPKKKIHAEVAVHEVGYDLNEALKQGAVLEHLHRTLEVACLPNDLPSHIDIDISKLEIDTILCVKDLTLPKGIEVVNDPETAILSLHAPKVVEEEPVATGEAPAEPEVIAKGKVAEEGEEGAVVKDAKAPKAEGKSDKK
jgi:large subunit ribosomal protein L25